MREKKNIETMKLFKTHKSYDEILPVFLMEKEIALSNRTLISYKGKTDDFGRWLAIRELRNVSLRKISQETISDYFIYLAKDRDLDRSTCEKYFLVLRSFFRYALKHGYVDFVPFDFHTFPAKKVDKSPEVIAKDDLSILLNTIKQRDEQLYLACLIQYYCFIRPGTELRLMKVGDIDFQQGIIRVPMLAAKNRTTETVTMPNQLIDLCKEYKLDEADKSLYVFGKQKRPSMDTLSINMFRYRFNKIRDELNLSKGIKFYSLKCTGASNLHNSGMPMRGLMDQLRHKKLDATQHYVKKHFGTVNERIRDEFPSPI